MNSNIVEKRTKDTLSAEIASVSSLGQSINSDFFKAIKLLKKRKGKILVTGVGKSGFIGMKMVATLVSLGHQASFLSPLDALHGDSGIVEQNDILIAFSYSGSSPELVQLIKHLRKHFTIKVIAITGNKDSVLAKLAQGVISFVVKEEGCPLGLAPMASTTSSLVLADCIASALTSPEIFKKEHFARFHPAGSLGLSLKRVEEVMRSGKKLPVVDSSTLFEEVLRVITKQKTAQMVGVVDQSGCLVGAIGDGDIRRMLLKHGDLRQKPVHIIMNKTPKTIESTSNLQVALDTMRAHKINNLFVVNEMKKYIGFIHIHDIVEA